MSFLSRPWKKGAWPKTWSIKATAGARKLADAKGVDLRRVAGTGKDGQITARDVRQYLKTRG